MEESNAWITGKQPVRGYDNYNAIVKELQGDLSDIEARITLARFLRNNIGMTFEMVSGIKLLPIQELIIRMILAKDKGLIVAGRGFSKSFIISILSILYPIFYPESKMCLISANFRGARRILEESETFMKKSEAKMLKVCFPHGLRRATDKFEIDLDNGSKVFALPLSSDGLRGTRAQLVCVDEGLLISKEIQDVILKPFLTNKAHIQEEMKVRKVEDELISKGVIKESDRISFPKNKYMVFSSASYKFQYLYKMFTEEVDKIVNYNPAVDDSPANGFVMRASYEVMAELPNHGVLDMTQINDAKKDGGDNTDYFKREYRALFSDTSDSYFNAEKMHECTVPINNYPVVQLQGDKESKYILAIDPSYAAAKNSDFFAMGVYLLIPEERKLCLVHTYGKAGGELKDHFEYLVYILTHFNIVFAVIDNSGSEFIKGFNESSIAKDRNMNLGFLDVDFDKEDIYLQELAKAKKQYNETNRTIFYGQNQNSQSNRILHEHLQNQIAAKKVWFGSRLEPNELEYQKALAMKLPFEFKNKNDKIFDIADFISAQDDWIEETKAQTSLIEVRATVLGSLQYDLPQNIRRNKNPDRPRKDNFTCLLLATRAAKLYYDMIFTETKKKNNYEDFRVSVVR